MQLWYHAGAIRHATRRPSLCYTYASHQTRRAWMPAPGLRQPTSLMRFLTRFNASPLLAGLVCLGLAGPACAGLPKTLSYTFFLGGKRVGHSDIRITQGRTTLLFDSKMDVKTGPKGITLTCRTEADPKTYVIRRFSFEGTKGGMPVAMDLAMEGDSAIGWNENNGDRYNRSVPRVGGDIVFEDWVMELEVLIALRQARSDHRADTYGLLFANSFLTSQVVAGYTGEVLLQGNGHSLAARKLQVEIQGGSPYLSMVDPATGVPVYLDFPGVHAEAFLDSFFGDHPESRYAPPPNKPSGR